MTKPDGAQEPDEPTGQPVEEPVGQPAEQSTEQQAGEPADGAGVYKSDGAEGDHPHAGDGEHGALTSDAGEGAGAVVATALGIVSLTGSWIGTVAGARESLIGQVRTSRGAGVATQLREVYGDQWHATALVAGIFALLALLVGVVVLAKPAFGAPGRQQASWIKAVSWAGVVLGVLGLLLAVLKYTDAILAVPTVQS
jgi:hypothetical protein